MARARPWRTVRAVVYCFLPIVGPSKFEVSKDSKGFRTVFGLVSTLEAAMSAVSEDLFGPSFMGSQPGDVDVSCGRRRWACFQLALYSSSCGTPGVPVKKSRVVGLLVVAQYRSHPKMGCPGKWNRQTRFDPLAQKFVAAAGLLAASNALALKC